MFDIDRMADAVSSAIKEFAESHPDEIFYAFAIDADMLCLNSEECFNQTLEQYRSQYKGKFQDDSEIEDLKSNTGDWEYQGFFDLEDEHGFDGDAYADHYDEAGKSESGTAAHTEYAKAMTTLIERLKQQSVFTPLRCSNSFRVSWVDHSY